MNCRFGLPIIQSKVERNMKEKVGCWKILKIKMSKQMELKWKIQTDLRLWYRPRDIMDNEYNES